MSYRFSDSLRGGSVRNCSQAVGKPVRQIPLLCVQWKTPDDGQRNCPKQVGFWPKNKFEKLVHLVGFIIRIYCLFTVGPPPPTTPRYVVTSHLTLFFTMVAVIIPYLISTVMSILWVTHIAHYSLSEVCITTSAQCDEPLFVPTRLSQKY